jgi:structural maintenance of chromosome 1
LIEQISGSEEYRDEYEQLKSELEKASEESAFNFNKKKGLAAEFKQYKLQKDEAERYEKLCTEKVCHFSIFNDDYGSCFSSLLIVD